MFTKSRRSSVNDEIFYICLFGSILPVILTSFSWAMTNTSAVFMVNMSDIVQKSPALIRKTLVNMFNVIKNIL